ncbi:ABC transporter permease [uncultured Amnibacterium sp.]|uniref:ABC transporter permease n=1 Tax=uncultured Amnibacterium sp. TaxID=1631851 RepID=UPI0035CBAF55
MVAVPAVRPRAAASTNALRYTLRRIGTSVGTILVCVVILAVLWQIAVSTSPISSFIAKGPLDVLGYFTQDSITGTAAEHRATIFALLGVTLGHAAIGFVVGVVLSVLIAIAFFLFAPIEAMFMPIALLLRTVPLLAMAPVIYLVFGDGLLTAALIGTIVVLFPILVNVTVGLRSANRQSIDLIHVNGGGRFSVLTKVAIPTALPHFFASMRIAVPGAITGAMLYEWLFTFQGMGAAVQTAKAQFDYPQIWAVTVFVTIVAILLYTVATFVEAAVLAEWGPDAGRAGGR